MDKQQSRTTSASGMGPRLLNLEDSRTLRGLGREDSQVHFVDVSHAPSLAAITSPTKYLAHVRLAGHPRVTVLVTFTTRRGRRVIEHVQVDASNGGQVTVAAFRAVRLGQIQGEVAEIIARADADGLLPTHLVDGFREWSRPGRKGRPPVEYAEIAAKYVECLGSAAPLRDLVARLGSGWTEAGARAALNRARRLKLLTAAPPGRAGGDLTPKAHQLLKGS